MPAPLRERLRAQPQLRLRDEDAGRTPLRARDADDKRSRHDIKQAERDTTAALTEQIGHEFAAMLQYVTIATYFESEGLPRLAQHFYRQAEEEREHAMRFVRYVVETGGEVTIPAIPAVLLMSTSTNGWLILRASSGISVCPPAMTVAPPPASARAATASGMVAGAT